MVIHIGREVSKLYRKVVMEVKVEWPLLLESWQFLLLGLVCQYLHGVAARGVHFLHRPGPLLQDMGFKILPELGPEKGYLSESIFAFIFFAFLLWTFHPFVFHTKRFYTVLIWPRVLAFLVASQFLRVITFYSTQLPGPNYHCREGSPLARLPPPDSFLDLLFITSRGVFYGCGDLIFSSHMIFTLVFVRTYYKYGTKRLIKFIAWVLVVLQSLLIVASRKHYTVDVVVAWYTVNLVVFFVDKKLPEMPDRTGGMGGMFLPVSVKDKDEDEKPVNGHAFDTIDRRRVQPNGKHTAADANHKPQDPADGT